MIRRFLLPLLLLPPGASRADEAAAAEAEAAKCRERIAAVRRDLLGKYEDQLGELQAQFQRAADLEGALATRAEKQRIHAEKALTPDHFAAEPRALRALQEQTAAKIEELCAGVVAESIPRLVEWKKALTIAGRLDDAVKVRGLIARLQNEHVPLTRPVAGELVAADQLVTAYAADRARADKAYKDVPLTVRGTLATYRIDANDPRRATVYLGSTSGTGWVACAFEGGVRFREEKSFHSTALVVMSAAGAALARWQPGQTIEIAGTCAGFEDVVRLAKCELPR